jgi:hypothetical protein
VQPSGFFRGVTLGGDTDCFFRGATFGSDADRFFGGATLGSDADRFFGGATLCGDACGFFGRTMFGSGEGSFFGRTTLRRDACSLFRGSPLGRCAFGSNPLCLLGFARRLFLRLAPRGNPQQLGGGLLLGGVARRLPCGPARLDLCALLIHEACRFDAPGLFIGAPFRLEPVELTRGLARVGLFFIGGRRIAPQTARAPAGQQTSQQHRQQEPQQHLIHEIASRLPRGFTRSD